MISSRARALCAILLLCLAPPAAVAAAPPLVVDPQAPRVAIDGRHIDLLEDVRQVHDLESLRGDAADAAFVSASAAVPIFQNVSGTVWARLRLKNPSTQALERSLVIEFANFHRMVVHLPEGDGYRSRELDVRRHLRDTDHGYRYPSYGLTIPPGATVTVFIAISSYSARFPLALWENGALERFALQEFWLQGLLFGIVLCALAYQVALTILARQSEHWSLVLCIVLTSLTLLCMLGYQHVYLGPAGDWLTRAYPALLSAMAGAIALFTRKFLVLGERLPRLDRALRFILWLYFGVAGLALVAPGLVSVAFAPIMLVGFALVIAALAGLARKRDTLAALYGLSFAPIVTTGVYGSLVNSRVAEMPEHYHTLIAGGFALGLLMFAFSSAYRIGQVSNERRLLQGARRSAEDRARMQAEFLANMSHDVRTPLNAVIGNLDMLDRHVDDPAQRQRLATAMAQCEILLGIFNQALEFARIEATPVEPAQDVFAFREIVAEVLEMVEPRAREKGLALTLEVDAAVPHALLGDGAKLGQVMLNLLSNAIKFTERGRVSVRAGVRTAAGFSAPRLRVDIEDTGIGIAPAAQAKVFERFVQADDSIRPRYGGTGLGLSICRTLVGALGGEIGIASEEGRGSTFWFEIPLRPCADPGPATAPGPAVAPCPPLRILLVEDSQVNRELVTAMLAEDGHGVCCAENGLQALEYLDIRPFDVVLMDVSMPEMDGVEATRRIRAREASRSGTMPILGLTAHAVAEKLASFIDAGMDDVLTKPVRLHELRRALNGIRLRTAGNPGAPCRPGIDRGIFDGHRERLGSEKLSRLLRQQFEETREKIAWARPREQAPAADAIAEQFHRLAGAFLFIGLPSLGELCRHIEQHPVPDADSLDRLAEELAAVEAELATILAAEHPADDRLRPSIATAS